MNIGTWTVEQLVIAVGHAPSGETQQDKVRTLLREKGGVNSHNLIGNYMKREWVARHPLHVIPDRSPCSWVVWIPVVICAQT